MRMCQIATIQAACALGYLFHVTLKQPEIAFTIPRRKSEARRTEILSRDEVGAIIGAAEHVTHRTLLMATYAAGLRVSEVCAECYIAL